MWPFDDVPPETCLAVGRVADFRPSPMVTVDAFRRHRPDLSALRPLRGGDRPDHIHGLGSRIDGRSKEAPVCEGS